MTKTILVVDDDVDLRATLCDALVTEGYVAIGAANGKDALDYLRRAPDPPCVILLDLMMPVMTGWAFLEEQRHDPALSNLRVVVMTADLTVKLDSIAATECIRKPFGLDALLAIAERYARPAP